MSAAITCAPTSAAHAVAEATIAWFEKRSLTDRVSAWSSRANSGVIARRWRRLGSPGPMSRAETRTPRSRSVTSASPRFASADVPSSETTSGLNPSTIRSAIGRPIARRNLAVRAVAGVTSNSRNSSVGISRSAGMAARKAASSKSSSSSAASASAIQVS